ncbi:MAG: radical SAM protein [Candidatus Cloacimonetes bacterium]|nr:radical SAM protein [Candidatus Cloacimonadota bacterium]
MLNMKDMVKNSESGLYEIVIGITSRCNFKCSFCYSSSSGQDVSELNYETIKDIIDQGYGMGVQVIAISGGEPFLHPEILEILEYAKKKCNVLIVSTNGFFINKDMAQKIKDIGVDNVQLSIEGNEEINNSLRGNPLGYKKALEALKNLKELGMDVTLTPTIQKENFDNIYHVWNLAREYKADLSIKRIVETGRGKDSTNISSSKYHDLYNFAIESNISSEDGSSKIFIHCDPLRVLFLDEKLIDFNRFSGCIAGKGLLYIKYNGDIYPCSKLPLVIGNIYRDELKDVYDSSLILKDLTNRSNLKGKCGKCKYAKVCGGCRATAYAQTEDYLEEDTMCWRRQR